MKGIFVGLVLLQSGAYGFAPSLPWRSSEVWATAGGGARAWRGAASFIQMSGDQTQPTAAEGSPSLLKNSQQEGQQVLYEEFSRYADKRSVAQEVIFEITSKEHFDDVISRAAGADGHEGYEDANGNWRVPHKLMMVQVHAGWCRVCKGLQPKLLKLIIKHPEVLCCKINKTHHEELAGKLGVRGLPMLIFYKNGKRVDHHTTANINTIEEAIRDNI